MTDEWPSASRFDAACLLAAFFAPVPLAFDLVGGEGNLVVNVLELLPLVLLFGFPIALLHLGLIALPIYMWLRRSWRLTWWNSALAGFAIGALPASLLFRTWDGASLTGLCGMVGGVVFWAVLKVGGNGGSPNRSDDTEETFA